MEDSLRSAKERKSHGFLKASSEVKSLTQPERLFQEDNTESEFPSFNPNAYSKSSTPSSSYHDESSFSSSKLIGNLSTFETSPHVEPSCLIASSLLESCFSFDSETSDELSLSEKENPWPKPSTAPQSSIPATYFQNPPSLSLLAPSRTSITTPYCTSIITPSCTSIATPSRASYVERTFIFLFCS